MIVKRMDELFVWKVLNINTYEKIFQSKQVNNLTNISDRFAAAYVSRFI